MIRNQRNSKIMLLVVIIAIIGVVFFAWIIPTLMADLQLDIQLYKNKAGGVDFMTVNLLNWAKIWAPLVPAALVTAILFYPKKFLSIFRVQSTTGRVKLAGIFSVIAFAVSYVISWLSGELSYGMFMSQYLQNDPSFVNFFDSFKALLIPFDLSPYDVNVLLTWKNITLPIMNAVVTAVIIRMVMEMIGARVNGGYAIEFLGRLFLVIGLVLGYFYLASPLSAYDAIEQTWLTILPLTMWTLVSVGSFCLFFSLVSKTLRDREEIAGAGFILTGIVIIAMVVVPCIVAAGDFFSRELKYEQVVWNGRAGWETNQTRVASDLTGFQRSTIEDLMDLNVSVGMQIASKIRPYDKGSSNELIESRITEVYETKGDTDIILFNGSEYWIAPRSFYPDAEAFGTATNRHVYYSNSRGFVAMDAHEGDLLDSSECIATFGVNDTYPVYFGEGSRNDLLLNITGWEEAHNQAYRGAPDAVLGGYLGALKVLGMSTDFISLMNQDLKYLHRTNIVDRIQGMLLPYMYMDEDPYLVFDRNATDIHSRMYYSIPLYISLPGFTYFKSDYRRFLGWVILNVYDGSMTFYRSPTMNSTTQLDSLISFARVYVDTDIYPWRYSNLVPGWLKDQLRYPENFYEAQLETDYTYHVDDWQAWHDKSDFYVRPEGGDLYYVLMDLGEGLEFVGMDLVVPPQGTTALAGMYVLRNNFNHFGETIFFGATSNMTLIGPSTANRTLLTFPANQTQLTPAAIPGRDTGNILLYEFEKSLYYVIPIYRTEVLQTLVYVGLVNAFDSNEVVLGRTPLEAFQKLAALHQTPLPPAQFSVNSTGPVSVTSPNLAKISVDVQNTIGNLTLPPENVSVSLHVYSQNSTLLINNLTQTARSLNDSFYSSLGTCANYSIGNWTLDPSELYGLTVYLNMTLDQFSSRTVPYRFVVTRKSNGEQFSSPIQTVTFNSPSHAASNITGSGVTLEFVLPTAVVEPSDATFQLLLTNNNLTVGSKNVEVRLTLFSINVTANSTVNGTVMVPGNSSIVTTPFSTDPMYPGHPGTNYTIIDQDIVSQGVYGISFLVGLNMTGLARVELVYRLELIVDGTPVDSTLLRIITWTA